MGIVIALITLPLVKALWVAAIVSAIVFVVGRWKRDIVPNPIPWVALLICLGSIAALIVHSTDDSDSKGGNAPAPKNEANPGKPIRVYDKVTSGPKAMRGDDEPVSLLKSLVAFCAEGKCRIPGTERETGGVYRFAVCQSQGEWVTNGDAASAVDNGNAGLFGSQRYYGVRLSNDTFGYVSEVWVSPKDRGGLGLPKC